MSYSSNLEEQFDARHFRTALGQYATGVAVMTTRTPSGKLEGVTANSFASVSLDPPLVLWSLRREAPSLASFLEAQSFAVNVLGNEHSDISQHFARPALEKFESVSFSPGLNGCPVLSDPIAVFECTVESTIDGGDHVILIGRVRRLSYRDGAPLIYSRGRYGTHAELPMALGQ